MKRRIILALALIGCVALLTAPFVLGAPTIGLLTWTQWGIAFIIAAIAIVGLMEREELKQPRDFSLHPALLFWLAMFVLAGFAG